MTPQVSTVELTRSRERPLLVVGSSLGTSVTALWGRCARLLENRFHVVGWDLALVCTGARIGEGPVWRDRRALVLRAGTQAVVESSRQRWFGPEFEARDPGTARALIDSLAETDPRGYAAVCGALADFDVRDRLGEITTPVLTIAGSADLPTPPALLRELADGMRARSVRRVARGWSLGTGGGSGRSGTAHHSALINKQHQPINGIFILVRYRSRLLAWI